MIFQQQDTSATELQSCIVARLLNPDQLMMSCLIQNTRTPRHSLTLSRILILTISRRIKRFGLKSSQISPCMKNAGLEIDVTTLQKSASKNQNLKQSEAIGQ